MKKLLIKCIVFCFLTSSLYCQNKTIKGRVINDQFEYMPMVSILIDNNIEVGKTDIDGFFQLQIPISKTKLLFTFVGLEHTTIELQDQCHEVEVIMILSGTYDFVTLKKADRLRKRRFKKLPELHKESFLKGIFKTERACYIQKFTYYCDKN